MIEFLAARNRIIRVSGEADTAFAAAGNWVPISGQPRKVSNSRRTKELK